MQLHLNSEHAVIFDMDGTMVDNMMVHHQAWQDTLRRYGMELSLAEVKEKVHGVNHQILLRLFGDRFNEAERAKISAEKESLYRGRFNPSLHIVPGLLEFLDYLRRHGVPMAIASAAPVENVDFILNRLSLRDHFKAVLHAGDVVQGKPNPEVFQKAAYMLERETNQCLVFEDSPTGAEAAYRAGCQTMILTTTHSKNDFDGFPGIKGFIKDYTAFHSLGHR